MLICLNWENIMGHKKNNIEFFGKFFLDKKEEPRSTKEEEYIYDWYARHNDIFEDEYKRYFALMIMHKMYHQEQWLALEDQENFLQLFLAEAEKRITRLFKAPKARENKVDRLKHLYKCMHSKKKKVFKVKRNVVVNKVSKDKPYTVPQTEIIQLY